MSMRESGVCPWEKLVCPLRSGVCPWGVRCVHGGGRGPVDVHGGESGKHCFKYNFHLKLSNIFLGNLNYEFEET